MQTSSNARLRRQELLRWTLPALLIAAGLAVGTPAARAQSTWTNPIGANWNDAGNWNTPIFPDAPNAIAIFNVNPLAGDVTLSADVTLGTLQINNAGASAINGQTIHFNDGASAQIQFNAGTWSIGSNIDMDSTLTLTGASNGTINGVISGGATEHLIKSGAGTVFLNNANTFTGMTAVNDGILRLDATNALGSTASVTVNGDGILRHGVGPGDVINDSALVILNGTSVFDLNGQLEIIGALAGGTNTEVMTGGGELRTGGNNLSTTHFGEISGAGQLIKNGTGTFTLAGTNTYTGATTVNAGRLDVNGSIASAVTVESGGTFGGTGSAPSVVVNAGGTFAPGNSIGTTTLNGGGVAYTQAAGSTYEVEINNLGTTPGTNNDLIDVTNPAATASLGGTVDVVDTTGGGFYEAGTTYTVLQTANPLGLLGQTYDGVTDNLAIRDAILLHGPNQVRVRLLRINGDFEANANTRNQRNVGGVLDGVNALATGDLGAVLDEMVVLPNDQKPKALDMLSGEIHASVAGITVQSTSLFVDTLARRLRSNSNGDVGVYGGVPAAPIGMPLVQMPTLDGMPTAAASLSDDFVVRAQGLGAPGYGSGFGPGGTPITGCPTCPQTLGRTWISGYGLGGDVDGDGNGNPFDYDIGGTAFGIERNVSPILVTGIVGGYSRTNLDSGSPPGNAKVDSLHIGLYGHLTEGLAYTSGLVAYGYQDYDTTRRIVFGGINRTARADYDGHEFTAYVEKGLNLNWYGWRVQPLMGLQYLTLNREAFQETGAGALNLTVNKDHVNSLRFSLGGRIAPEPPAGVVGAIVPEFRGRWVHEFMDDNQAISSNFAGAPGANFIANSSKLGRNFGIVGAGLNIQLGPLAHLFLDYDYQFSSQLRSHAGTGGLEFLW